MTTTNPTLADFAAALDRIRERWPDAPGLPEGYYFKDIGGIGTVLYLEYPPASADLVAKHAALALCVTTAMEIGAWWVQRDYGNRSQFVYAGDCQWWVEIWERHGIGHDKDDGSIPAPTLPSAALAMLVGIGGEE